MSTRPPPRRSVMISCSSATAGLDAEKAVSMIVNGFKGCLGSCRWSSPKGKLEIGLKGLDSRRFARNQRSAASVDDKATGDPSGAESVPSPEWLEKSTLGNAVGGTQRHRCPVAFKQTLWSLTWSCVPEALP